MTIGIYKLTFEGTDRVYIGQSQSIEYRYTQHLNYLKRDVSSKKLQEAYTKYGKPLLVILAECEKEELDSLEDEAIAVYNSFNDGFNSLENARDVPILVGEVHPGSKYSNAQITEAFLLLIESTYTHQQIAEKTGVSKNMVNHIAAGTCHTWLKTTFPEEYSKLIENKPMAGTSKERCKVYPLVKGPEGIIYLIDNLRKFSREHGIPYSSLNSLVNFRTKSTKGWEVYKV